MIHTLFILLFTLFSPNGQLSATFEGNTYSMSKGNQTVIERSSLGLNMDNWSWEMALGFRSLKQYDSWMEPMVLDSAVQGTMVDTMWTPFYGERSVIRERYNPMRLYFSRHDASLYRIEVEVRLYDTGLAFRYFLPEHPNAIFHRVVEDETTYTLPDNTTYYAQYWAQDKIHTIEQGTRTKEQGQRAMEMPLTFTLPDGLWGTVMTADVDHWCHTRLQQQGRTLVSKMLSPVDVVTYAYTPWKLVAVAPSAARLAEIGSDFVAMHAEPRQALDFSYVRPGKIMRCTQLTMDAARRTIDFCAQHKIDYMLFDWKWYMPCASHDGDATHPIEELDMPALCRYAKEHGVGIWLYVNQHALMKQARELFPVLHEWGVVGVKSGFVEYATHRWSEWVHDLVRLAADNQLMMNIHDEYRPSGFSRTYPNLLTQEGICGNEEFPDATHDVNLLFTRMLCGAADYTVCYKDSRLKNTKDHQKAAAVCYYSPLVTLFWYDKAEQYSEADDLTWFEQLPTTWDETRVLALEPNQYAAIARRSGDTWYIGVLNGNEQRTITLDLSNLVGTRNKDKGQRTIHLEARGGAAFTVKATIPTVEQTIAYCHEQIERSLAMLPAPEQGQPRNIFASDQTWNLRANVPEEWCNGFWSGCLWYDYALRTKDKGQKTKDTQARSYTKPLEALATQPVYDHDLGFQTITSMLNGYRFTGDKHYRELLIACADSLATLYNPQVGTMLSWPRNKMMFGGHNTILDNLMNLELLMWAGKRDIAIAHADTTMRYQFREDGSSYHVAVYDTITGKHLYNCTHQGLNDESTWARGQAWAIYGYTMMYRYTREKRFLDFAQKVTDWYLNHLPADYIPYWDFSLLPYTSTPLFQKKDASAACITMSALLELSEYVPKAKAKVYREAAEKMYRSLTMSYEAGELNTAILLHSTGHCPAGSEVDCSIIYADYYFMEALYRMKYGIKYLRR